jgi:hypothetical protein
MSYSHTIRRGAELAGNLAPWVRIAVTVQFLITIAALAIESSAFSQDRPLLLPPPELSGETANVPLLRDRPSEVTSKGDGGVLLRPSFPDDQQLQLDRLPDPLEGAADDGSFPDSPLDPIYTEDEYFDGISPQKLNPYKNGFFQKLSLSVAQIGSGRGDGDFSLTEIETALTVAVPMPIREWPMLITPGYNLRLLDGPGGPVGSDLPPRLNDVYLDFTWLPTFVHRHTLMLSVAPSYFSDFEANHERAFRLTGKALWIFDARPDELQLVAGVLYLNRDNIRLLPAGGAIWCPTDWTKFELIFPKPKIALRYNVGQGYEDWVFGTAEFGGNTWAIERESGLPDNVTLLDYRILGGVERKLNGGAGYRLEGGYVFGRSVEYSSNVGNFDPPSTFIVRGGVTY